MKKIFYLFIGLCLFMTSCNEESEVLNEILRNERIMLVNSLDSIKREISKTIAFNDSLNRLNQYMMTNQESRERNDKLINERNLLENIITKNVNINNQLKNQHKSLIDQINRDNLALSVSKNIYIIKIKIHQTTYTLDLGEYIKNKINDVEFEIPVDKEYYDKCSIGQKVTDTGLKIGSLLRDGDFSKLKITITGKRTIKRN